MILKTSDLAICAEVSPTTIREYSNQGLLGQVTRLSSSYRVFDPRLIPQTHLVKLLRELGVSRQELLEYGQNRTPEAAIALFRRCSEQLRGEIAQLQAKLDMLQSFVSLIQAGCEAKPGEIQLCTLPERAVRLSAFSSSGADGNSRQKSLERLRRAHGQIRQNGNAGCPLGYVYSDFSSLLQAADQPAGLVSLDPKGPDLLPAGEYLTGTAACYYDENTSLPKRMLQYAQSHGLQPSGPAYMVYLHDAASVTSQEQHLLQITVGIQ